jgi:Multiubiquitin
MSNATTEASSDNEHQETVAIIVNGRQKTVPKNEDITFDAVVALAFPNPPAGDGVQFTVQYTRGDGKKPSGTLVEGQSVKVKNGMEFDVTSTNRS